jgi:formylglycine-generating enzyme required for sulfatase activity
VVGGPCYPNGTCNTGLVCLGDVCAVASVDDTGVDTGDDTGVDSGGDTDGSGDTGPAPDTDTPPVEETIGPAGGVIEFGDFRLTVPAGALTADTAIVISYAADQAPAGYDLYTGVYRFEPAGTTFAIPATVSARFTGDSGRATLFWTPDGGTGFERRGGRVGTDGRLEEQITHFSEGFVGDGVTYTDLSDRSCVVTRLVEGRNATSAGINGGLALFFTVDDCQGRPVTGLAAADFSLLEDGRALSSEAQATILPADGRGIFVSLVLDFSASTEPVLPELLDGAAAFLDALEAARLPAQVQLMAFGGEATAYVAQAYTLDLAAARTALNELAAWRPSDIGATNLHGAVVQALGESEAAQAAFRARNLGGAFSSGYVVVFTDGGDTAERVNLAQVQSAVSASADEVFMVGLRGADYDAAALTAITSPQNVLAAPSAAEIEREFAALANRLAGQALSTYLLGYCSPKRAGSHTVSVQVTGAENRSTASFDFGADGFTGSCRAAAFATVCEGNECGGLGCGACDDRAGQCVLDGGGFLCVSHCLLFDECSDAPVTTELGYELLCEQTLDRTDCGFGCTSVRADVENCGSCGNLCAIGGDCADGVCECSGVDGRECGGVCRDVDSDFDNCGSCGNRCAVGAYCAAGVCFCPTDRHEEAGFCVSDTRSCRVTNGTGTESWTGTEWGSCVATCNTAYHLESGACVSDTRSCSILNGTGFQVWSSGSLDYGICSLLSCSSGYHARDGACAADVISCSLANAASASQTWDGVSAYGPCTATACNGGFYVSESICTLQLPLGSACLSNIECASGYCATNPTGTANDRCAPPGMVWIPSGTFAMGSTEDEAGRYPDETWHAVTITRPFFMGDSEVTQGQWKVLSGGTNPSYFQSTTGRESSTANANDAGPVEQVDWYSVVAFANAKSAVGGLPSCYALTGCSDPTSGWKDGIHSGCTGATSVGPSCTGYRLPTESEWEYAARSGTSTATHLGNLTGTGNDCFTAQPALDGIAWWCINASGRTQPVRAKSANYWGLYDMLGNVWEMTGDRMGIYPETVTDPTGASSGGSRVVRGGSWSYFSVARDARAATRASGATETRGNNVGFRLARTVSIGSTAACGNGIIEAGEACDGANLNSQTCSSRGYASGTLRCSSCGFDTTACLSASSVCGNGIIEAGETCDGTAVNSLQCADFGFGGGGTLRCASDCLGYDDTSCVQTPFCGDGVVNGVESCDGLNFGGQTCVGVGFVGGNLNCDPDCTTDYSGCSRAVANLCNPSEALTLLIPGTQTGSLTGAEPMNGPRTGSYYRVYAVSLTAGRTYSITMTATGGGFDTYLYLYGGVTCGEVAFDDDGAATANDSLLTFTPTVSGTYYLVATTYGSATTGTYTLTTN